MQDLSSAPMISIRFLATFISISALYANAAAQSLVSPPDKDHDHDHHRHHHELGVANAPVYFLNEKEVSYGLHFHYVYTVAHSKFGIGLGYERIFDEHEHHTVGMVGNYRPNDHWSLNVSPGLTFEGAEKDPGRFALHIESSYEFALDNIHLGPVFEIAYDPEDIHISLGLHLGLGF